MKVTYSVAKTTLLMTILFFSHNALCHAETFDDHSSKKNKLEHAADYIEDSIITGKIKSALLANTSINSFDINVVTINGLVILRGVVDDEDQIIKTLDIVRKINGVQSITNQLIIRK